MEQLTWTGPFGDSVDIVLALLAAQFALAISLLLARSLLVPAHEAATLNPDGTLTRQGTVRRLAPSAVFTALLLATLYGAATLPGWTGVLLAFVVALIPGAIVAAILDGLPNGAAMFFVKLTFGLLVLVAALYLFAGIVLPDFSVGIIGAVSDRLLPVWIALIVTYALSITFKRRLGLYGKLFDSTVGMIGFGIVMFWVYTAVFGGAFNMILTHPVLEQVSGMKNKVPGTPFRGEGYPFYLLGGDNLARDVFSRVVAGSWEVIKIAPFATLFAFMVGITLGLPAGYYGGKLDTFLSFLANLILAFPVILLFYLLVTPEIVATGIPIYMAGVLFLFPIIFFSVLWNSRFRQQPQVRNIYLALTIVIGGWLYLGIAWDADPLGLVSFPPNLLVVFVSVVFVNSPTVFRIVRGLTLDIKTRDYVAAAQTRGEGPWYIMLWEILPNARGPLIVDFCLRIGYTTILLGTLGFFGLGLSPESPDWGSTINEGRKLLSIYLHPALPPALSLLSLVLGLNLLADGLREESLRD